VYRSQVSDELECPTYVPLEKFLQFKLIFDANFVKRDKHRHDVFSVSCSPSHQPPTTRGWYSRGALRRIHGESWLLEA